MMRPPSIFADGFDQFPGFALRCSNGVLCFGRASLLTTGANATYGFEELNQAPLSSAEDGALLTALAPRSATMRAPTDKPTFLSVSTNGLLGVVLLIPHLH